MAKRYSDATDPDDRAAQRAAAEAAAREASKAAALQAHYDIQAQEILKRAKDNDN